MCVVFLPAEDRTVNIVSDQLEPVIPQAKDHIKVIDGNYRDTVGELLSIDNHEGVISAVGGKVHLIPLKSLCKLAKDK